MYFYFDESGDYAFPEDRFDCYVQAALICPDSALDEINRLANDRRLTWGVEELHATNLSADNLLEIARLIGGSDCELLAQATDTRIVSAADIERFRLDQAARLRENLDWYRRESAKIHGEPVKEIEEWMLQQIKRAGLRSQISHGEFLQAHFMFELIKDALQKSLYWFHEDRWRDDLVAFHFVLDAKLPNKMAAGEKYLQRSIAPFLGSRRHDSLGLPETWKEPPLHPFVRKYERERGRIRGEEIEGVIDVGLIFEHGLQFEPSHEHGGLQLVDTVPYVIRRAVLEPENEVVHQAYGAFRHRLRRADGRSLRICGLPRREDRPPLTHYEAVYR